MGPFFKDKCNASDFEGDGRAALPNKKGASQTRGQGPKIHCAIRQGGKNSTRESGFKLVAQAPSKEDTVQKRWPRVKRGGMGHISGMAPNKSDQEQARAPQRDQRGEDQARRTSAKQEGQTPSERDKEQTEERQRPNKGAMTRAEGHSNQTRAATVRRERHRLDKWCKNRSQTPTTQRARPKMGGNTKQTKRG